MGRSFLLAVDESQASQNAAKWCCNTLVGPGDKIYLVTVTPPPTYSVAPAAPIATAGAVAALSMNWEQQRRAEEQRAQETLVATAKRITEGDQVSPQQVHASLLPAAGGASGVAESLVTFGKEKGVDLVVIGSRGMGAVKSTLMSMVGLGSVSDYCIHNVAGAVAVVRGRDADAEAKPRHKVMVALDESDLSKDALTWATKCLLGPHDELHLVSVALPVPYQIAAEDAVAAHVLENEEQQQAAEDSLGFAQEVARDGVEAAVAQGVGRDRIFLKALQPEGGASDVAQSLVHYARENGVDLAVVGSRGMGSLKRAVMSFVGLGSVSDYITHHLECPVVVYKKPVQQ